MAVVVNFYFSIFLQLTWEFLGIESEREGSVCWPNNKIKMGEKYVHGERSIGLMNIHYYKISFTEAL